MKELKGNVKHYQELTENKNSGQHIMESGMKKIAVFTIFSLICGSAFVLFYGKTTQDISQNDIDILKNSIVIDSLKMDSSEPAGSEGYVIYDDSFVVIDDNRELTDKIIEDKHSEKIKTGKEYFSELKSADIRWHLKKVRIMKNDNLISIANDYGSDVSYIAKYNSIKDASKIRAGSSIYVPTRAGMLYEVKKGDTATSLSRLYGIALNDIKSTNRMDINSINAGEKIFLPSAKQKICSVKSQTKTVKYGADKQARNLALDRNDELKKMRNRYSFMVPVSGKITSSFGIRRNPFSGKREFHNGIDIGCVIGTEVKSSAEGKVIFCGWKAGYGNMIVLEHKARMISVYAHLDSFKIQEGDSVKSGQLIALSGATGTVTGPHLHFEIRKNYVTPLNPSRIIK